MNVSESADCFAIEILSRCEFPCDDDLLSPFKQHSRLDALYIDLNLEKCRFFTELVAV